MQDRDQLVILCGAGVSVAAPARVPAWWSFNEAVVDGLRRSYTSQRTTPVRSSTALGRLSLSRLDLTEFSQVVHDAFAGVTWFDLLAVLDGHSPNATHRALAGAAKGGSSRRIGTIVTTNFDTLIERALDDAGVQYRVLEALVDGPSDDPGLVTVVKLHGSASNAASLVDLAMQKRRGLPDAWSGWLAQLFSERPVLVLGFSGADLDLRDDYLGLLKAGASTPSLRWLTLPGTAPHPRAAEVVARCGERGAFIEGALPGALELVGLKQPGGADTEVEADAGTSAASGVLADADDRLLAAVDTWLHEPGVDAEVCGLALYRLLRQAGWPSAAEALRTQVLTRAKRDLRAGVSVVGALRASQVIAQAASDAPPAQAVRALYDLDLAERAMRAAVSHMRPLSAASEEQFQAGLVYHAHNEGYLHVTLRQPDEAEAAVVRARSLSQHLTGDRLLRAQASECEILGAVAHLRGDDEQAEILWRRCAALSHRAGDQRRAAAAEQRLAALTPAVP